MSVNKGLELKLSPFFPPSTPLNALNSSICTEVRAIWRKRWKWGISHLMFPIGYQCCVTGTWEFWGLSTYQEAVKRNNSLSILFSILNVPSLGLFKQSERTISGPSKGFYIRKKRAENKQMAQILLQVHPVGKLLNFFFKFFRTQRQKAPLKTLFMAESSLNL